MKSLNNLGSQQDKKCTRCSYEYPPSLVYFGSDAKGKYGLSSICRNCHNAKTRLYYLSEGKIKAAARYREVVLSDRQRERRLISRYGITPDEYHLMLDHQCDCCLICHRRFLYQSHRDMPYIDHDHKTGQMRGLLCGNCNSGIGQLRDSFPLVKTAAQYLHQTYDYHSQISA